MQSPAPGLQLGVVTQRRFCWFQEAAKGFHGIVNASGVKIAVVF
jgi:hypothetical protein